MERCAGRGLLWVVLLLAVVAILAALYMKEPVKAGKSDEAGRAGESAGPEMTSDRPPPKKEGLIQGADEVADYLTGKTAVETGVLMKRQIRSIQGKQKERQKEQEEAAKP